ncbi:Hypothetical predicted protein [Olea europaea subsp. europaea]|uniref:Uncharacterized protein n=1 Tax=Olea europaea subsp. europaea TaxID=158383 RepID=A0A8S0SGX6_OLEEU|nr:Hypothetical predicted protein [Olea europaea subsp. europaea]
MEGLIPFVYKAIVQYRNGESSSAYYARLPGDSGRLQPSDIELFQSDCGFAAGSSPPEDTKRFSSTAVQSPVGRHLTSWSAIKG